MEITAAIARATCRVAEMTEATLIITPTAKGGAARLVSASRPPVPILALSCSESTVRRLCLQWGVVPCWVTAFTATDELFYVSRLKAAEMGLAKAGERAVVTAGLPFNVVGTTNLLQVMEI